MAKRDIPEINAGSMADIAFLLLIFFLVTTTMEKELATVKMLPKKKDTPDQIQQTEVSEYDLMEVLADDKGQLLVRDEPMRIEELKKFTLKFYEYNKEVPTPEKGVSVFKPADDGSVGYPRYKEFDRGTLDQGLLDMQDSVAKYEAFENKDDVINSVIKAYENLVSYYEKRITVHEEIGDFKQPSDRLLIRVVNFSGTEYGHYYTVLDQIQAAIDEIREKEAKRLWGTSYAKIKKAMNEPKKVQAFEIASKRKKILEILVPARVAEKQENR